MTTVNEAIQIAKREMGHEKISLECGRLDSCTVCTQDAGHTQESYRKRKA